MTDNMFYFLLVVVSLLACFCFAFVLFGFYILDSCFGIMFLVKRA